MNRGWVQAVAKGQGALACLLLLAGLFHVPVALGDEDGRVKVRNAYAELRDGVFYLNARLDYRLGEEAAEALRSGVTLDLELEIKVERRRRYLWDPTVAALRQLYQLSYHALSERYLVRNVNSGEQTSFANLEAALLELGRVRDLPIIDESLLDERDRYVVRLRAIVDIRELSGPLSILTFFWNDWRIASDWYQWPLQK